MTRQFLGLALAGMLVAAPTSALALTVDFTNSSAYSTAAPGDYLEAYPFSGGPVTVSVSSNGLLTLTNYDGNGYNPDGLALNNDGFGVGDDEITTGSEFITVSFSKTVRVTGLYFLDLFYDPNNRGNFEQAVAESDLGASRTVSAIEPFQSNGGYLYSILASPFLANSVKFTANAGNDGQGFADYALAGLEISAVPLPAGLPLLAGGLGLMGLVGLRGKRKAAGA